LNLKIQEMNQPLVSCYCTLISIEDQLR